MPRSNGRPDLGVVAIGRNEGERLRRCLESLRLQCETIVYVDSGSKDGSVELARGLGVEVVELDLSIPFTAARARNEGLQRLRELRPGLEFVQFVDGDCELVSGWIEAALHAMSERANVAVVCGRRRERFRNATIYNRLCDIEWNTPIGEAEACGGDALMRVAAVAAVEGYDPSLICGEEPDLCRRMRANGSIVMRIHADMTLHDAAMTRAGQWWQRMSRGGYACIESWSRNRAQTPELDRRCVRGVLIWAVVYPFLAAAAVGTAAWRGSPATGLLVAGIALGLMLAQTIRIALRGPPGGERGRDALLYGASCMLGKFPQLQGMLLFTRNQLGKRTPRLIEYK